MRMEERSWSFCAPSPASRIRAPTSATEPRRGGGAPERSRAIKGSGGPTGTPIGSLLVIATTRHSPGRLRTPARVHREGMARDEARSLRYEPKGRLRHILERWDAYVRKEMHRRDCGF